MAGYTYYYFSSIILVIGCVYTIALLAYLGSKRSLSASKYRPGTPEYGRLRKLTSRRTLLIVGAITLLPVVNLAYATQRVFNLHTRDANFLLIFAPISLILFFLVLYVKVIHNKIVSDIMKSPRNKAKKDDDSWLV